MRTKVHPGSWQPQCRPREEGVGAGQEELLLVATHRPPTGRGCPGRPSLSLLGGSSLTVVPTPLTWALLPRWDSAAWAQNQGADRGIEWSSCLLLRLVGAHVWGPKMSGNVREPRCPACPEGRAVGEKAGLVLPATAHGGAAQQPPAPRALPGCPGARLCCRALQLPRPARLLRMPSLWSLASQPGHWALCSSHARG